MPETREARSLVEAAEQAAAAGDYASAEELLRHAALLQEAELGPLHPDLANTLNNLGVVCEIVDKPADAERFYVRAHEIAAAVLATDHPFVATSRQNLTDFYRARGGTFESSMPPAARAAEREAEAKSPAPPPDAAPSGSLLQPERARVVPQPEPARLVPPPEPPRLVLELEPAPAVPQPEPFPAVPRALALPSESRAHPARRQSRRMAITVLIVAGLVVVALMASGPWFRSNEPGEASTAATTPSPPDTPAPAREPVEPMAAPPKEVAPNPPNAAIEGSRGSSASVPAQSMLASAQLCRALSPGGASDGWRCTPPSRPVDAGLLFFYTRVKSATDTTVEHRWYRDDRLYHSVNLRVRANQTDGYRTNSRFTIDAKSPGNWRVELRTQDGILVHEERFVVR